MNAGEAPAAEAPAEAPAAEEAPAEDGAKWTAKPCPYGIEDGEYFPLLAVWLSAKLVLDTRQCRS